MRYVLDDPRVECIEPDPLGVLGTVPLVRADRAVSGVGALIMDFLGVSVTCLLLRLLAKFVVDDRRAFAVPGVGLVIFARRLAVMNGCRKAA